MQIVLQFRAVRAGISPATPRVVETTETREVESSPGRTYSAVVGGRVRCFERVATDAEGNDWYREQVGS